MATDTINTDQLDAFFSNPGAQCTIFPFLDAPEGSTPGTPACWDLWFNAIFVHVRLKGELASAAVPPRPPPLRPAGRFWRSAPRPGPRTRNAPTASTQLRNFESLSD